MNSDSSPVQINLTPENEQESWDLGAVAAILKLRGIKHRVMNAGDDRPSLVLPLVSSMLPDPISGDTQ